MKPLIETNPYLKDKETRERLIKRSVETSSGVEGIVIISEDLTHCWYCNKLIPKSISVYAGKSLNSLDKFDKYFCDTSCEFHYNGTDQRHWPESNMDYPNIRGE